MTISQFNLVLPSKETGLTRGLFDLCLTSPALSPVKTPCHDVVAFRDLSKKPGLCFITVTFINQQIMKSFPDSITVATYHGFVSTCRDNCSDDVNEM